MGRVSQAQLGCSSRGRGTTLQPSDDFVGRRFTGRDLLHHRNIRICIFPSEWLAVGFKEQPHGEKSGSLVAVRQRMVAGQMLNQDGPLSL